MLRKVCKLSPNPGGGGAHDTGFVQFKGGARGPVTLTTAVPHLTRLEAKAYPGPVKLENEEQGVPREASS